MALFRALGDRRGIANCLHGLGTVARNQEDFTTARTLYQEGLALRQALGDRQSIASSLAALAAVAVAQGQPTRAARLWGTAEAVRDAIGTSLAPADRADYERTVAAACAGLDEAVWAAAWAEGRGMPLEEAIATALEGG